MQYHVDLPTSIARPRAASFVYGLPLVGLLLLLACAPYAAMGRALWTDESYSISYAAHPTLGGLLEDVRKNEETPPLYFVLLWVWLGFFGQGEVAARALSLAFGACAAVAVPWVANRLLNRRGALLATIAFALSPMLHRYLIEARGYTLTILLTAITIGVFERLLRHPDSRRWQVAYTLSAVTLFITSYFGVALLAAQGCLLIWGACAPRLQPRRLKALAMMLLAAGALTAWWLPALLYQVRIAPAVTSSMRQAAIDFGLLTINCFLIFSSLVGEPTTGWRFLPWLLATAATIIVLLASALNPRRELRSLALRSFLLPAIFLLAIVFAMGVIVPRYLLILLPGAAIVVGVGVETLVQRRQLLGGMVAAILLGGLLTFTTTAYRAPKLNAWVEMSAILAQEVDQSSDIIVLQPPYNQRLLEYYYKGEPVAILGAHHYDDFYVQGGLPFSQSWTSEQLLPRIGDARRIWVIRDNFFKSPQIDLSYHVQGTWKLGLLELTLYAREPEPSLGVGSQ